MGISRHGVDAVLMLPAAREERPVRGAPLARVAAFLVVGLGLAFLYRAPAGFVWAAWQGDPYYSHGFAVFLFAAGLATWRLWKAGAAPESVPAWALVGVPVALAAYLLGFLRGDAYVLSWSALLLAGGIALATGGLARLRLLAAPLLLAALTLPTPWTLEAGVWLQGIATRAATGVLTLFGVSLHAGVTSLSAGGLDFEVTPACSGIQSAVSLLAVAACIATLFSMSDARRRVVLGAAIPLALLLNVARLVAVVLIGLAWGQGAAEGFFHGASSALIFVVETLILLALAGVLRRPERA